MNMIAAFTKVFEEKAVFSPILQAFCKMYYNKAVQKEVNLASIKKSDRVLCIGGGPLPWTALEIAKRTGAKVDVIDVDTRAIFFAKQAVERFQLSQQIEISYASGQEVDPSQYSVIHVALQARPHDKILKNILGKSKLGTRVLMRYPHDKLNKFYHALPEDCLCDICNSTQQKHSTMSETLLFVKGLRGEQREEIFAHNFGLDIHRSATMAK